MPGDFRQLWVFLTRKRASLARLIIPMTIKIFFLVLEAEKYVGNLYLNLQLVQKLFYTYGEQF